MPQIAVGLGLVFLAWLGTVVRKTREDEANQKKAEKADKIRKMTEEGKTVIHTEYVDGEEVTVYSHAK